VCATPSDTSQVLVPTTTLAYDRIWEVCEELEMPIHRHANFVGDPVSPEFGYAGPAVATLEGNFFAHRSLGHLIVGGVFDRFPGLKYVTTEQALVGSFRTSRKLMQFTLQRSNGGVSPTFSPAMPCDG